MKIKKQGDNFQKIQGEKNQKKSWNLERVFFRKTIAEIISQKHEAHSLWGKQHPGFLKVFQNYFFFFEKL